MRRAPIRARRGPGGTGPAGEQGVRCPRGFPSLAGDVRGQLSFLSCSAWLLCPLDGQRKQGDGRAIGRNCTTGKDNMQLRFLGIIPNTPVDDSPTIWLDKDSGDLLIQSYKATDDEVTACQEIGSIPGHSTDVPDHEAIIRLPAVMLQYIPRPEVGDGEVPRT